MSSGFFVGVEEQMDEATVTLSVADLAARFAWMMAYLMGFSVALYGGLNVVFKTNWYIHVLGNGPDGRGSRWTRYLEFRPWISMACGVAWAVLSHTNLLTYLTGYTYDQVMGFHSDLYAFGVWFTGHGWAKATLLFGEVVTGLMLGGGPKAVLWAARTAKEGFGKLQVTVKEKSVDAS